MLIPATCKQKMKFFLNQDSIYLFSKKLLDECTEFGPAASDMTNNPALNGGSKLRQTALDAIRPFFWQ